MGHEHQRLTIREKAGYGCGDFASVLYWQTISAYILYFYTDIFGITAAAGAVAVGLTLFYKLDENTMRDIEKDLNERRIARGEPTAKEGAPP